jgi:hypothetical protein
MWGWSAERCVAEWALLAADDVDGADYDGCGDAGATGDGEYVFHYAATAAAVPMPRYFSITCFTCC